MVMSTSPFYSIIKIHYSLSIVCSLFFFINASSLHAAEQELKFSYDALGRLTFVYDDVNGNRDYDYDAAGNRTSVHVGNESDKQEPPQAPTGLRTVSSYAPGVYTSTWNAVPGATYYIYRPNVYGSIKEYTTTSTRFTEYGKGDWVKACNDGGCGLRAEF